MQYISHLRQKVSTLQQNAAYGRMIDRTTRNKVRSRNYFYSEAPSHEVLNSREPRESGDLFIASCRYSFRNNKDEPFFVHMAYYSVHGKHQQVPEFIEKYENKESVDATYASMIEKMDQGIGKILDELDRLGLKENTLVRFSSDNGGICETSSQAPFRAGKGSYFEGGIREPMVVRWSKRVKANSTCAVPVIGIDFYPTFLEAAGVPVPNEKLIDGVSLMPLLTDSGSIPDRTLFWHFPVYLHKYAGAADQSHDPLFRTRPGSALRQGKWKLHEYFEDGRVELYDLEADIGERKQVADWSSLNRRRVGSGGSWVGSGSGLACWSSLHRHRVGSGGSWAWRGSG